MRKILVSLALVSGAACASTPGPREDAPHIALLDSAAPVDRQAAALCSRFATPDRAAELLAPSFLSQVPAAQVAAIFGDYRQRAGRCVDVQRTEGEESSARYQLRFEKGFGVSMAVSVDPREPHQVVGLWLGNPVQAYADLQAIVAEMRALPGTVSFLVADVDATGLHPRASLAPKRQLAIGSAFKLWVLAELVRSIEAGEHRWDEVAFLTAGGKSLPSGMLQDWPEGSPLTVQTLATLMISRSDNTATDNLIRLLGRERIEATMRAVGHAEPARNEPFLTTRELFLLKDEAAGAGFLAREVDGRREYLDDIVAQLDPKEAPTLVRPTRIDAIEWFASAHDLANVLDWLRKKGEQDAVVRQVLSVNAGIDAARTGRTWVGFKGGSEPGVLNLSFVLEDPRGVQVVVATWNDPQANLEENRLIGLVERALVLLAPEKSTPSARAQR